jgi:glutaredoxin
VREFLSENNVEFVERNIRRDPEAKQHVLAMLGVEAVPVTVIDGEIIVGFDRERLEALLA